MDNISIKNQLRIGNYVATQMSNNSICLATLPTEKNNGGQVIAIYNPVTDLKIYPFVEQHFNAALAGDKASQNALHVRCTTLFLCKNLTIIDPQFANEIIQSATALYERVEKAYAATGVEDIEVQTDDEFFKTQEVLDAASKEA